MITHMRHQIVNQLTAEKVEEQREVMDYILEGNQRIIDCIQAVQASIKGGEKAKYIPLARMNYREKHKENLEMMQKPTPPKPRFTDNFSFQKKSTNQLEEIYNEVSMLRIFVEKLQSDGILGLRETDEIIDKLYNLQNRIYTISNSDS